MSTKLKLSYYLGKNKIDLKKFCEQMNFKSYNDITKYCSDKNIRCDISQEDMYNFFIKVEKVEKVEKVKEVKKVEKVKEVKTLNMKNFIEYKDVIIKSYDE